jgi:cell division protein FtsB
MAFQGAGKHVKKISVALLASVILAAGFIIGFGREYLHNREIEKDIADLQSENERLQGKKFEFLGLIKDLSSEYYLEDQARVKGGMAKPGETLVLVDDHDAKKNPDGKVLGESAEDAGVSNVTRWLYYFFDHKRFTELERL